VIFFSWSLQLRDTLASAEPILTYLTPQMDSLHLFCRAEQVTFHYYAGSVFLIKEELRPVCDLASYFMTSLTLHV